MSIIPVEVPTGAIRYNTDSNKMECFNGTKWYEISVSSPDLNGGARGLIGGGYYGAAINNIQYITITTAGNAADFGNLTAARSSCKACSSATRAIVIGGFISPAYVNTIDFFTMASSGNATDFGDSTTVSGDSSPCSNSIRGYRVGGGNDSTQMNSIDFVTFSTTGDAQDFGDLPVVQSESGGCSDSHGGLS